MGKTPGLPPLPPVSDGHENSGRDNMGEGVREAAAFVGLTIGIILLLLYLAGGLA